VRHERRQHDGHERRRREDQRRDLRDRPALQGRVLRERAEARGDEHPGEPEEKRRKRAMLEVVREELRREAVPGEGEPGADRDERAQGTPESREHVREQRRRAKQAERDDKGRARVVACLVCGSRPADRADASCDGQNCDDLAPADRLLQERRADHEQEDEPDRECRLDEREWGERKGKRLQRPAAEVEPDPEQPARPPYEPPEQADPQGVLLRNLPGLERLERDTSAVQSRGPERGEQPEEETAH
jgi:hypothetical protein